MEEARHQVKIIKEDIQTQEDLQAYMAKLMSKPMDADKPLWEIHVKENYTEDSSVVFCIIHHLLSDGMGIVGLITFLNDHHSPDSVVDQRRIGFFSRYICPVFWIPFGVVEYIIKGIYWKGDRNMYPLYCKKDVQSNKKSLHETKHYQFEQLKK